MAPELAISALKTLETGSVVLDPMMGSGTVIREASRLGHTAIGFDFDPLAVLMSDVSISPFHQAKVEELLESVLDECNKKRRRRISLPWIDQDDETRQFIRFWFAEPQRSHIGQIAEQLFQLGQNPQDKTTHSAINILKLALSRIIITKNEGASLARDVSHSRPHKVANKIAFEVLPAFASSVRQVVRQLSSSASNGKASVQRGDARSLKAIRDCTVDLVLTSPPYLNAIDYMRGHRLALVWLGYKLPDLRLIRSNSIGAERGPSSTTLDLPTEAIKKAIGTVDKLSNRHEAMISRYCSDIYMMTSEVGRVLKPSGKAVFVIGDSCISGVFVRNSNALIKAASMCGLRMTSRTERMLPIQNRYLPMPSSSAVSLGKRMRTETVLRFRRAP